MIFSSRVPPSVPKGTMLVDYLAGRFTYTTREGWHACIAAGKITRNGSLARAFESVAAGDVVSYDAGEFEEPAADLAYRIIYEDQWVLGIDKPGNLLVHRAGKSFRHNLIYQLRYVHTPPYAASHTVHRLDRDTSGVVLIAKNTAARAVFGREFAAGKVRKRYLAVVRGAPDVQEIGFSIGKSAHSGISYKHGVDPDGKTAITRIIASQRVGSAHALLTVQPLTGRTHQIRIHLAAIGALIVGDRLYGLPEADYLKWRDDPAHFPQAFPFRRHALHCASLAFTHPYTDKECLIEADMPQDMRDLIEWLLKL